METNNKQTKKKKKQRKDTAVQGTNDSSVLSKASAAARGYFLDGFLQHFVCKESRRAPLINRGYYVRWRAVDQCVRSFLQVTERCPRRQIVSLGAGFDSLYFRLRAEGALSGAVLLELDFPDVARRKTDLIRSNESLREMLDQDSAPDTGGVCVLSGQYRLLGVDLRELTQVTEALEAAGLERAAPTLLLSEVVLTYMETKWSDLVIGWAAKLLPQSLFVMYEQLRPDDPFGRIMQTHFLRINSPLQALHTYPSAAAHTHRFLQQGWDQCVCLDMNDFYLRLIPEDERSRVEALEPFDEYEEWHQKCSHYFLLTACRGSSLSPSLLPRPPAAPVRSVPRPWALRVAPVPVCVEGQGMGSAPLGPGRLLLTGGAGRGGRGGAPSRVLIREEGGWRAQDLDLDLGVRLYHTATCWPGGGGGVVLFGGRASPLSPVRRSCVMLLLLLEPHAAAAAAAPPAPPPPGGGTIKLHAEEMTCTGEAAAPRWRHTAAVVSHKGKDFLFVFGGKNESAAVLGDGHFLCLDERRWTQVPVEGVTPAPRHSHAACSYQGGAVMFGGLGAGGVPQGDTLLLRPTDRGFCWERVEVRPPPAPRYSHCSRVIGHKLVSVGGVWLQGDGVPGAVVIDLTTGGSAEFRLDTTSVSWPLLLHSFCCERTEPEEPELLLIGGGGNCFSFGTHLNPQPVTLDLRPALGPGPGLDL